MQEKTRRQEKIEELLRHISSQFFREIAGTHSLITVTRTSVSRDLKKATIYITVLPAEKEEEALSFVKRHGHELRTRAKQGLSTRTLPFFDFEIDYGEKNRQRIEELSRKERLEKE